MRLFSKSVKQRSAIIPTEEWQGFEPHSEMTSVEKIKANRQRTVERFKRNGQWFYLKTCRIDGVRAWFRDLFRGPKARLEFNNAVKLAARKILAVVPVAWSGRAWPGESKIVTREVPNAIPLTDYLTQRLPKLPVEQQRQLARMLARSFGRFIASLYAAGVIHPDPHPGNFLVSFDDHGEAVFTLADVHALCFSASLSTKAIVENLILVNRWFQLRTSRTDRLRFWTVFRLALVQLRHEDCRTIERRTMESNLRFWFRRFARYRGNNREFRTYRHGPYRGFVSRIAVPDSLLADPDAILLRSDIVVMKSSRSSIVVSVAETPSEGCRRFILKRIPVKSWLSPVKNLIRSSAIIRSWLYGLSMRDRYLPTPRPMFAVHHYRFGIPCEGYLLTEEQCDAVTLDRAVARVADRNDATIILVAWAERLGRLVRTMHDRGVVHGDLKAANVLLTFDDSDPQSVEISMVDLVGTTTSRSVHRTDRIRDVARLAASFLNNSAITHAVQSRFLTAYCDAFPRFSLDWRDVSSAVMRKSRRNADRGRMLG